MIICDNSLCNIDLSDKITRKSVQDYILALFESGIDLVEIDRKTSCYLSGVNTSNRFIYRAESLEFLFDLSIHREYAYICVPEGLFFLAQMVTRRLLEKINEAAGESGKNSETDRPAMKKTNYIVEVKGNGRTFDELLDICRKLSKEEFVSVIRIVKSFKSDTEELSDFIDRYYNEINTPLDICPLNSELNGVTAAYEAFGKDVNMITLSFGSPHLYTPYELFVLYFPPALGLSPAMVFTSYLYVAAARFSAVSDSPNTALRNLNDVLDSSKRSAVNIDAAKKETIPRRYAVPKPKAEGNFTGVQKVFCDCNGIEPEMGKELSDALDNFDMSLYSRFLQKGDFEN